MIEELIVEQGSQEWLHARRGLVTCSRFGSVLGTVNEKNRYLKDLRSPPASFTSKPTEWGKSYEKQALAQYMLATGHKVTAAGLLLSKDFPGVGGSPDGLVLHSAANFDTENTNDPIGRRLCYSDGQIVGGVEIKCPYDPAVHQHHVKYGLPQKYFWQIHGYIWLTGASWWDFVSYDPRASDGGSLFYQRIHREGRNLRLLSLAIDEFLHVLKCDSWFGSPTARAAIMSGEAINLLKK